MKAEIISVGTELLLGQIVDTNAAYLGQVLPEYGVHHTHRQTVGDHLQRLAEALHLALSRSDIVFTIGGLGPTQDDLTREAIALSLNEELVLNHTVEKQIKELFERRKLQWRDSQSRQAMLPPSGKPISNPNGTAPGLLCEKDAKVVLALPGPKGEFNPMVDGFVRKYLSEKATGETIRSRVLKIIGLGESVIEEKLGDLIQGDNPTLASYAHVGEVHLRLTASGDSNQKIDDLLSELEQSIRQKLGTYVYAKDQETLEGILVNHLVKEGKTLSVAESCTGGGLGERITRVSGASAIFEGGVISYSNTIKQKMLGVSEKTLQEKGAVSKECAQEMAEGIRTKFQTTYGLSITGIAGPTGGSPEKPVGLVYVGCTSPKKTEVREHRFIGKRADIQERSVFACLALLREQLLQKS